jgi:4-amino-4-deoxy-L-arabinose transferase-like glycosyltransferase
MQGARRRTWTTKLSPSGCAPWAIWSKNTHDISKLRRPAAGGSARDLELNTSTFVKRFSQLDPPAGSVSAAGLRRDRVALAVMVGVLLVAAGLRLVVLADVPPGLSHDEAYNGVTALEVWLLGRREVFFDIYNGIEPLIVYWQALYMRLFGISPFAMRLVNVTAGLLTVPLTYALARRLLGGLGTRTARLGALLAASGVALSFWAVFVSRLALRAVTLPLLELPALYCLWRGLAGEAEDRSNGHPRRLAYFAAGGAWMGAAMYTYLSSRFLPFVPLLFFAYWLLRGQARRRHWQGMAVFFLVWAAVFAPLALYYWQHPDIFARRAGQVLNLPLALAGDPHPLIVSTLRTLGMFSVVGADTSRYGLAGRPLFDPLGAVFFHVGLLVSLVRLRRPPRQSAPYALLLIWWLVMLVPDFITAESPHFLRTIGALPPAYIFWSLGLLSAGAWLARWIPPPARRWALPAAGLYLILSGGLGVYDYFGRWAADVEARLIYGADFTEVARYLESEEPGSPVVLSAAYYRDWDRFRLDLQTHHRPPFVVWFDGQQTFLMPPPGSGLDPVYIFPRSAPPHPLWLELLQLEAQGKEMQVYRLRPEAQARMRDRLQPIQNPQAAAVEAAPSRPPAQLLGYVLEGEQRAGERLRLLLHWQPLLDVPGDPDYAFFAHLRDRRDYTWAQVDASGYAVVDWQPGVQVLQWLELPLAPDLPPLTYTLTVGLEDRSVGQPLTPPIGLTAFAPSVARAPVKADEFPVPNPGQASAGRLFTLRGYSWDPRFMKPGGSAHVTLFWQAQAAPGADYRLRVWLADEAGRSMTIASRQPLDGDYPTSRWSAGQWVRDRFDLTLPSDLPGGLYRVYADWRDSSGTALEAENEPGIPLGEVFIAE